MTPKEQEIILSDFPNIKLSYETKVHKKVYNADISIAIPDGVRHFAWFTTFKNENVCWLLELSNTNQIIHVKSCITSFTDVLSYGTILYGTMFKYSNNMCFSVEDMFFYKGENLQHYNFLKKLELIQQMFSLEMSMVAVNNRFVIFGSPFMDTNFGKVLQMIPTLPYKSTIIQFRYLEGHKTNQCYNMNYIKPRPQYLTNQNQPQKQNLHKTIFKITPDIQNDIYKLHTLENGEYVFYDYAYIPSYVSSVMMNRLFRNIKENHNLDALEESDDEAEFENNNLDKYVFLDKSFLMNCEFNHKFKKWFPVNVAFDDAIVISSKQLK